MDSLSSFNFFSKEKQFFCCDLQFEEVARIIDSREELGSVILRNTGADDKVLEILADPLKNSHDLKVSVETVKSDFQSTCNINAKIKNMKYS